MFKEYDPSSGKRLQLLKEDGTLTEAAKKYPLMSSDQVLKAFEFMTRARMADEWAVSLNRQGRMPTYAPNKGQEANSMGVLLALRQDDWIVPAFREMAGMLYRGLPLSQLYLYWLGNEMGSSYDIEKFHMMPISVPLASQTLHAVGLAYADKYRKRDRVSATFIGDGATSEGDFYEAINFAGAWNTANIFYIQNNQWAISTPRRMQTAVEVLAIKAKAAGIDGIQIDGNDVLAVFAATTMAAEKARKGGGATLIEGYTYRLGAHTTADDPTRYRDESEVCEWLERDPLLRLERYILAQKLMSEAQIKELRERIDLEVKKAFEEAEKYPAPSLEDTFRYTFKEMPELLHEQMERIKANGMEDL